MPVPPSAPGRTSARSANAGRPVSDGPPAEAFPDRLDGLLASIRSTASSKTDWGLVDGFLGLDSSTASTASTSEMPRTGEVCRVSTSTKTVKTV